MVDVSMLSGVTPDYMTTIAENTLLGTKTQETDGSFASVLSAAMSAIGETNDLQNQAESAEIQFALGMADNPHDAQIAASKALSALQYTQAIKDKLIEAYRELMNMQI